MNSEYTHDMMIDTVAGLVLSVYRGDGISPENLAALWGCVHWYQDMVNQLAGEG
jgi:hypothetical protein